MDRQQWKKKLKRFCLYAYIIFIIGMILQSFMTDIMLGYAVKTGSIRGVNIIMSIGSKPKWHLGDAVRYALESDASSRSGRLQIVSALVRRCFPDGHTLYEYEQRVTGRNPNRDLNRALDSALGMALKYRDAQLLNALLDGGLLPDELSSNNQPLIFEIIRTGSLDLLTTLHAHGANLNLRNAAGETPLAVASCPEHADIVNYLVSQGVDATESPSRLCSEAPRHDPDDKFSNPPPEYPRLSRRLKEQGTVLLRVHVSADGRPETVQVHQSSGFPRLDKSATKAIRRWRFVPAQKNGVPESSWVIVPVQFSLQ
jgi:TonB family protein